MSDVKKDAPTVPGSNAPIQKDCNASVPANAGNVNGNDAQAPQKPRFRGDKTKVLSAHAKVNTLAIKCYIEQLPYGERYLLDQIAKTKPSDAQIMAIKHNRDIVTDGIWLASAAKEHWHIIVRLTDSHRRMRVYHMLAALGVVFRQDVDDDLWIGHGVETIGNFAGYAVYLTHETAEAVRDGKEPYSRDEVVSNLSMEEQDQIREGYVRVSAKRAASQAELVALDAEAYDLGYALKGFDAWYDAQPFVVRSNAKIRVIRESYNRGVRARIALFEEIDRLCVFIKGEPNTGKTYAATVALERKGLRVLPVKGGGTGKMDKLQADHDAIVVDDETMPNLLNMADSYVCQPYRRNKDNPPWTGRYLVVTSNDDFLVWLVKCGLKPIDERGHLTPHGVAMQTRFVVGEIVEQADGTSRLVIRREGINFRGDVGKQQRLADMLADFKARYNEVISTYNPHRGQVDLSGVVDYYVDDDAPRGPRALPREFGYTVAARM